MQDVSKYPNLIAAMLARGATDEQARLFAGENILRVWKDVEKVAAEIRGAQTRDALPNEAVWEGRVWAKGHSWLPYLFPGTKRRLHGNSKAPEPKGFEFNIRT